MEGVARPETGGPILDRAFAAPDAPVEYRGTVRSPWSVVVVLGALQVALSAGTLARGHGGVTYVFTPLVDVVPGGVPLSAGEASDLASEAKNQVDARDIQRAYARLGSTISLDNLLRGVDALEDLTPAQEVRVATILTRATSDHRAVRAVQGEILDLEAGLDRQGQEILALLPEEARRRVGSRR